MPIASRDAQVTWIGTVASGHGELRTGALSGSIPMEWASRSEQAEGTTSPEELLAASHASCYAMTLSLMLSREGHKPEAIDVRGTCKLDHQEDASPEYRISRVELEVEADVPGLEDEPFQELARRAEEECAVSAALRGGGAQLGLEARLRQAA
jgi:osmotically inducible protein OsmC